MAHGFEKDESSQCLNVLGGGNLILHFCYDHNYGFSFADFTHTFLSKE